MIDVYFGCGCFWHVQHEFVEAERELLGRGRNDGNDDENANNGAPTTMMITSRVGYAGGTETRDGMVCYPNAYNGIYGDYRKEGHAEVVALRIPPHSFPNFAAVYFRLFDAFTGYRPDQLQDTGPEYRSLVGVPGGKDSIYWDQLTKAAAAAAAGSGSGAKNNKQGKPISLLVGEGNDDDVVAAAYVMDTAEFPFYLGERYHQFHDGFQTGEDYPDEYNALAAELRYGSKSRFNSMGEPNSMCPNGCLGIGRWGL